MVATPSPPRRTARTPPTPLHGTKYDTYEPYSPRRSSRLSNMQTISDKAELSPSAKNRARLAQNSLHSTNSQHRRSAIRRTSSQTYSPPDSPVSSPKTIKSKLQNRATALDPDMVHESMSSKNPNGLDSDLDNTTDNLHKTDKVSKLTTTGNALPTPSKTPRKQAIHANPQIKNTARVLFANTSDDIPENTMPSQSARKIRKSKMSNVARTLDSFEEDANGATDNGIKIYTDSKERIPDTQVDDADDNPFVAKRTRKTQQDQGMDGQQESSAKRGKSKYGMGKAIDDAVDNNEGMVYVFRGKKIFRKFTDAPSTNSNETPTKIADSVIDPTAEADIVRRIGDAAQRPFHRSSVKPKKLFEAELAQAEAEEEAPTDADEEAVTDIEIGKTTGAANDDIAPAGISGATPKKGKRTAKDWLPATPPTTVKKVRHSEFQVDVPFSGQVDGVESDAEEEQTSSQHSQSKRSPFDSWNRTKGGKGSAESDAGTGKRGGDPVEKDGVGKRLRGATRS